MTADLVTATGMVLTSMPVGDYDKRIQILTKELGLITVFVRGAKKPQSAFSAVANPFVFGQFDLYRGRSAYNLAKANIKDYFSDVTTSLDCVYYGSYFLELAGYYGRENVDASEQLNLLYITLKALQDPRFDHDLVRVIYELKTLVINGEYPDVFSCAICGKKEDLVALSKLRSGCLCSDCRGKESAILLQEGALYTLQYIITSRIEALYTFRVTDEVLENLRNIMADLLKRYVDRKMKSLVFLES